MNLKINYSWPVQLINFSKDEAQENFSRGQLKVFYKGETADHRYFSDSFSEKLIESLPYTPVVSYWDAGRDDFVGHATEQQILGIVDPCIAPRFEKDDKGVEWCVCDVVLYTERPDQTGDLAKKIVGHPQSLELDPHSVKYTINYDDKRHFKNIEFTEGKFVGVSVLGNDQKPAFTGSAFFSCDEKFESKMKILREYCENDQKTKGGQVMDLAEFMKLSWGDISKAVEEKLAAEYGNEAYTLIVDMFEDNAIVRFYSYIDGSNKLFRVKYTCDEKGEITLGTVNEVHVVYEDIVEEPKNEESVEQATEQENLGVATATEDPIVEGATQEQVVEHEEINAAEVVSTALDVVIHEETIEQQTENLPEVQVDDVSQASVSNAEITDEKKVSENETIEQEDSSASAFAQSQVEELEALKREKKIALLDSYKEDLSNEEYADFTARIDEFDNDSLELELLRRYKRDNKETRVERVFNIVNPINTNNNSDSLDSLVRKHLR
nr:MAG TPA: hypothetical protein [Caudoviricetes sp.]